MEDSTRQTIARISSELMSIGQCLQIGKIEKDRLSIYIHRIDRLVDSINLIKETKSSAYKRKFKEGLCLYKDALLFVLQSIDKGAELDEDYIQKLNRSAEIKIQQGVREMRKRM